MNCHRNYSILGNDCVPQTIAIPSNTKFLSCFDEVYDKKYTNTLYYPGNEEDTVLNNPNKSNFIDNLKTFVKSKNCTSC